MIPHEYLFCTLYNSDHVRKPVFFKVGKIPGAPEKISRLPGMSAYLERYKMGAVVMCDESIQTSNLFYIIDAINIKTLQGKAPKSKLYKAESYLLRYEDVNDSALGMDDETTHVPEWDVAGSWDDIKNRTERCLQTCKKHQYPLFMVMPIECKFGTLPFVYTSIMDVERKIIEQESGVLA